MECATHIPIFALRAVLAKAYVIGRPSATAASTADSDTVSDTPVICQTSTSRLTMSASARPTSPSIREFAWREIDRTAARCPRRPDVKHGPAVDHKTGHEPTAVAIRQPAREVHCLGTLTSGQTGAQENGG